MKVLSVVSAYCPPLSYVFMLCALPMPTITLCVLHPQCCFHALAACCLTHMLLTGIANVHIAFNCSNLSGGRGMTVWLLYIPSFSLNLPLDTAVAKRCAGQFVARIQKVRGVDFSYQPPPRNIVPYAAALKGQHPRSVTVSLPQQPICSPVAMYSKRL